MDESTGNVRLADEFSPPEPEDIATDSKPAAGNAWTEETQSDAGTPAFEVERTEPEPERSSALAEAASGAVAEHQPDELEKPPS